MRAMKIVKALLIFGILLLLLMASSCVTKKACQRKFPPQVSKDSIYIEKEVIRYKDTIIYIQMEADTVYNTDTVIINEDGQIVSQRLESELKYSYAAAWIENNRLNLEHITKEDSIAQLIEDAIREKSTHTESVVKEIIVEEVQYIPWWAKILMVLSIPTIIYILFRIFKLLV